MVIRCSICGEALIPRADHKKGRYVYKDHDHSSEREEESEEKKTRRRQKSCPICDGDGEKRTADGEDIETCTRCYGSGTIYEEEMIE